MKHGRNGLTIVELVVFASIASLLFAVLVPALQHLREAARNETCKNNLVTIGQAALEYDDVNGQFPPYLSLCQNVETILDFQDQALNYPHTYSLTQLLAYLGRQDLVDRCDPIAFDLACITLGDVGYSQFGNEWLFEITKERPGVGAILFNNQVDTFRCPADTTAQVWEVILMMISPTNTGASGLYYVPANLESVRTLTNYTSNMGAIAVTDTPTNPDFEGWHGPIRSRISDSIDTIPDGASTTVLFGENIGNISEFTPLQNSRYSAALGGASIGRPDLYNTGVEGVFGSAKG